MATLASVPELAAYTGRAVDEGDVSARLVLDLATALVQSETRQTLFYVENDTITLPGGGTQLVLPERPVVGTPTVAGIDSTRYAYLGGGVLAYGTNVVANIDDTLGAWPKLVTVTYSHGFQAVPLDLRAACLAIAARLLARSTSPDGVIQSETIGSYSVTYAREIASSAIVDESRVIARYRRSKASALL